MCSIGAGVYGHLQTLIPLYLGIAGLLFESWGLTNGQGPGNSETTQRQRGQERNLCASDSPRLQALL